MTIIMLGSVTEHELIDCPWPEHALLVDALVSLSCFPWSSRHDANLKPRTPKPKLEHQTQTEPKPVYKPFRLGLPKPRTPTRLTRLQLTGLRSQLVDNTRSSSSTKPGHQTQRGFHLDAVIAHSPPFCQLPAGIDNALLLPWDARLVLQLRLAARFCFVFFGPQRMAPKILGPGGRLLGESVNNSVWKSPVGSAKQNP